MLENAAEVTFPVTPSTSKVLMRVLVALSAFVIVARAWTLLTVPTQQLCGSDFPVFYSGGQLIGTHSLYSAEAVQELERRYMGCSSSYAVFIRLPYFAAVMKLWNQLPFWPAFWLWRLASVFAAGIFVWFWPGEKGVGAHCVCMVMALALYDHERSG